MKTYKQYLNEEITSRYNTDDEIMSKVKDWFPIKIKSKSKIDLHLIYYVAIQDLEKVKELVAEGADINNELQSAYSSYSLLRYAIHAWKGDYSVVDYFLFELKIKPDIYSLFELIKNRFTKYFIKVNEMYPDIIENYEHKGKLLTEAVSNNNIDLVKYLIENDICDVNSKDGDPLIYSSQKGFIEIAKYLLDKGADPNLPGSSSWVVPSRGKAITLSTEYGHFDIMILLIENDAEYLSHQKQLLKSVCKKLDGKYSKAFKALKYLLDKGCELDANCVSYIKNKTQEILEWIIKYDAKYINAVYRYLSPTRKKMYAYLISSGKDFDIFETKFYNDYNELLINSVQTGDLNGVKKALINGANIDIQNNGYTALMWASYGGRIEIVKYLIDNGANIDIQSNDGNTALIFAIDGRRIEIVKYLIDNGANIDIQNNNGDTALIWASLYGHTEICKLIATKILETQPYRAHELLKYLTDEQKLKYKEFIATGDFDIFEKKEEWFPHIINKFHSNPKYNETIEKFVNHFIHIVGKTSPLDITYIREVQYDDNKNNLVLWNVSIHNRIEYEFDSKKSLEDYIELVMKEISKQYNCKITFVPPFSLNNINMVFHMNIKEIEMWNAVNLDFEIFEGLKLGRKSEIREILDDYGKLNIKIYYRPKHNHYKTSKGKTYNINEIIERYYFVDDSGMIDYHIESSDDHYIVIENNKKNYYFRHIKNDVFKGSLEECVKYIITHFITRDFDIFEGNLFKKEEIKLNDEEVKILYYEVLKIFKEYTDTNPWIKAGIPPFTTYKDSLKYKNNKLYIYLSINSNDSNKLKIIKENIKNLLKCDIRIKHSIFTKKHGDYLLCEIILSNLNETKPFLTLQKDFDMFESMKIKLPYEIKDIDNYINKLIEKYNLSKILSFITTTDEIKDKNNLTPLILFFDERTGYDNFYIHYNRYENRYELRKSISDWKYKSYYSNNIYDVIDHFFLSFVSDDFEIFESKHDKIYDEFGFELRIKLKFAECGIEVNTRKVNDRKINPTLQDFFDEFNRIPEYTEKGKYIVSYVKPLGNGKGWAPSIPVFEVEYDGNKIIVNHVKMKLNKEFYNINDAVDYMATEMELYLGLNDFEILNDD